MYHTRVTSPPRNPLQIAPVPRPVLWTQQRFPETATPILMRSGPETIATARRSAHLMKTVSDHLLMTVVGIFFSMSASCAANPFLVRTFRENGQETDNIIVHGRPSALIAERVAVPVPDVAAGNITLTRAGRCHTG